jgi:gliding motility-associated-like protein
MKQFLTTVVLGATGIMMSYGQMVNTGEITILENTEVTLLSDLKNIDNSQLMNDGQLNIYKHFQNNGTIDFINQGQISFLGEDKQSISGTATVYTYDLWFENAKSRDFDIETSVEVANEAAFKAGVVHLIGNEASFTFGNNAQAVEMSHDSFVDGWVKKMGQQDFVFPIGNDGFYRPAELTEINQANEMFQMQYVWADPAGNGQLRPLDQKSKSIKDINDTEYWNYTSLNEDSIAILTLSWDELTTATPILEGNLNTLRIVFWDEQQQVWMDLGGAIDVANQRITTINPIKSSGVYTLATGNEEYILPGDIVVYNGLSPNGDGVNDFLRFDGLEKYPENSVTIFNRWGSVVFETKGYDNEENVFKGFSQGNLTVSGDKTLPTGTYFYVLDYKLEEDVQSLPIRKSGYIYISGE